MPLPQCATDLPPELNALIAEFGRIWATAATRPRPTTEVSLHWARLVAEWIEAPDLPLLIRKHKDNRGSVVTHATGRHLVPTDNSPAHWAFTLACEGARPTLPEIREWFAKDEIPIVMIQKRVERPIAKYHCFLRKHFNVNEAGWKLGHIASVGLNTRQPLAEIAMATLHASFQSLIDPRNMFVVPLTWAGLAEVDSVIEAIAEAQR